MQNNKFNMNLPALVRSPQQDVYMSLTILGCTVNCRFRFADCPLIHCEISWLTCIPLHFGNSLHSHVWRYNETSKEILHLDSPGRGDSNEYSLILIFFVLDDHSKCRVGENAIFEISEIITSKIETHRGSL